MNNDELNKIIGNRIYSMIRVASNRGIFITKDKFKEKLSEIGSFLRDEILNYIKRERQGWLHEYQEIEKSYDDTFCECQDMFKQYYFKNINIRHDTPNVNKLNNNLIYCAKCHLKLKNYTREEMQL